MSGKTIQSRFARIIKLPIKLLCKARDAYVKSITECSSSGMYGGAVIGPGGQAPSLPRSFSAFSQGSSGSEDLRELIRANSASLTEITRFVVRSSTNGPARSFSVGMGRIDEEGPCVIGDDLIVKRRREEVYYPRSKSCAVECRGAGF